MRWNPGASYSHMNRGRRRERWLTFYISVDYAYVSPAKNSDDGAEIFSVPTHRPGGKIAATEDLLEVDF